MGYHASTKDDSMNTILEQYKDKISGSFSFFDRT